MEIKAFDLSRANTGCYLTVIDAQQLFPLCRVERVAANPVEGFQRQLDAPRAKRIAKYLEDKIIPGAIVLSAQKNAEMEYDPASGILSIKDNPGSLLVIDGQHRLYGAQIAADAGNNTMLPVCILTSLSLQQEVHYFIDINSTARGVPKTLRIELTKFLVEEGSIDEIRLRLFRDLNENPDSPLCGRLSAEQKGPGYLSHVPFEIAINKILRSDRLAELSYNDKKKLISNYLTGIYQNLLEMNSTQKLTQSAFFQAVFRVFDKACDQALLFRQNYKSESFVYVFEALLKINFELHTGTNEESIASLEKDLIDKLDIDKKTKLASELF